jgi:hypothetical protein
VVVGAIGPRQADLDQLLRRLDHRTRALTFTYGRGRVVTASTGISPRRACLVRWSRRR